MGSKRNATCCGTFAWALRSAHSTRIGVIVSTLEIRCKCGELYHAEERDAGRRIKCRQCGTMVEIRHQRATRQQNAAVPKRTRSGASILDGRLKSLASRARGGAMSVLLAARDTMHSTPLVRALAIAVSSYLVIALALWLLLWNLGDRWWPATVLLFSGRWIFLTPLVLLLPAALVFRRTLVAPLILAAAIIIGPVMGFHLGLARLLPRAPGEHMRVVSLNADEGSSIAPQLPILILQWDADIVAIQECGQTLTEATRQMPDWHHNVVNGTCLLSRYPITKVDVMDRSALERVKQDELAGIGGAGYVARYTIATPRGDISFTNLHLETPRKGLETLGDFNVWRLRLNTHLRDVESDLARRSVNRGRGPTLVVGDFNTPVESRIFQEHWGDLTDAFSQVGFGLGMTKYNGWIRVRIDHVLSSPEWQVDRAFVGADVGSDHRPLIVDLSLRGAAAGKHD